MIEQVNFKVKSGSAFTTICPFPIGYIYMASVSTSPASTFGGTWNAITDGRLWSPSDSYNVTSGSWTHTLTINEIPWHEHKLGNKVAQGIKCGYTTAGGDGDKLYYGNLAPGRNIYEFIGEYVEGVGGGEAHSIENPRRTCYCWVRTA